MVCDASRIHEGAATELFSSFGADCVAYPPKSSIVHSGKKRELYITVNFNGATLEGPRIGAYATADNQSFKRYTNNEVIANADRVILCITQHTGVTLLQYGKALFAKASSVGDIYEKETLNEMTIGEVHESINYDLHHYRWIHSWTDLITYTFQSQLPLVVQNELKIKNRTQPN